MRAILAAGSEATVGHLEYRKSAVTLAGRPGVSKATIHNDLREVGWATVTQR